MKNKFGLADNVLPENLTYKDARSFIIQHLKHIYDEGEAGAVTDELLFRLLGISRDKRVLLNNTKLTGEEYIILKEAHSELLMGKPVQYVTGICTFLDLALKVGPGVLIPRPETEELVMLTQNLVDTHLPAWQLRSTQKLALLDIGTGSGCIAISLARRYADAAVYACDISEQAIDIASYNALNNKTLVHFFNCNVLDDKLPRLLRRQYNCIISNPPYVRQSEKAEMARHVVFHEPEIALYVADEDPLIYYRAIAQKGVDYLYPGGLLIFEINENLGREMHNMLIGYAYEGVTLCKDLHDKDRFIYGYKADSFVTA